VRDAHSIAVDAALKTNDELERLFARLGTTDAPRGRVLAAYRLAHRALQGNASNLDVVVGVLADLRRMVRDVVADVFHDAVEVGMAQAERELGAYGLAMPMVGVVSTTAALDAVLSIIDSQVTQIRAQLLSGIGDESLILGDEDRDGMLTPRPVVGTAATWVSALTMLAWTSSIERATHSTRDAYRRQAVAVIDERTTDCCLRVNGQVVGLNEDFHLTGTPRFADHLRNPPFHWYCRTSVALVRVEDMDDALTREMREAGRAELRARGQTGRRVEIHPAHARSRR